MLDIAIVFIVFIFGDYLGVHTGDTAVTQFRGSEGVLIICEFTVSGSDIQISQHNKTQRVTNKISNSA